MSAPRSLGSRAFGVLALCSALSSCGEFVEEEVEVGLRGEARRNRFLALERFCTEMGLPALGVESYVEPPPHDQVLFCPRSIVSYGGATTNELLDWVHAGGHAVVHGFTPEEVQDGDPLADALDVSFRRRGGIRSPRRIQEWSEPTRILQRFHGEGIITLIGDPSAFDNKHIGQSGHAARWWELLELPDRNPTAIVFVRGEDVSWLSLALRQAWPLAISLAVFALIWMLWRAARFGPRIAEPAAEQRAFADHVRATGRYLARVRGTEGSVRALQEIVSRRLRRTRPEFSELDDGALAETFASMHSLDEAACRAALTEVPRSRRVPHQIQTLLRMLRTT